MAVIAFSYPAVLTNKDWQRNKGLLAKSKPTGIGEKLTALDKAFQGAFFGKVDPQVLAAETLDPVTFTKKKATFLKAINAQGTKLKQSAEDCLTTIKPAVAIFAKDKSVSKYLQTLQIALKGFQAEVQPNGGYATECEKEISAAYKLRLKQDNYIRSLLASAATYRQKWKDLLADIKKVESEPTYDNIHDVFDGDNNARAFTTASQFWDQVIAKHLPELASTIYTGKAMTEFKDLPLLLDFANESSFVATNELKKVAGAHPEERVVKTAMLKLSQSAMKLEALVSHFEKVLSVVKKAM